MINTECTNNNLLIDIQHFSLSSKMEVFIIGWYEILFK